MKYFLAYGLCVLLLLLAAPTYATAADKVIVGVNMMGVDQIGDAQQEALAQQLQDNGVKTIRTSLGGHGDRYTSFVIKAYRHGIGSVVLVSPFADNTAKHALAPDAAAGHPWGLPALQDADAQGFRKWLAPELAKLHPILPQLRLDGVSIPATLEFFRQNGVDKMVDGYAVHVYPSENPSLTVSERVDTLNKDAFAQCTSAKPCWLTEWGFNNNDKSCPVDDAKRVQLIGAMRDALTQFARQRRLAAAVYFSWGGHPGEAGSTVFRCGALTDAGKLALSPM